MKMGSKSQHCQIWYMKVGTAFPSDRHCQEWMFGRVGLCMNGRWGDAFCVPYECPQLRVCSFKLFVSRALWTCSVGQRQYLGRLAAGVPAAAKLCPSLPKPLPCLPPFRTRAYPQASEKPAC
ncbi:hypothetical protein I79_013099 [Cricetulus griseus]|uniref:Uncharacterized protein n=1 Tax=Cricetulus griseus TaxID=10029 RepID=G3HQJ5_CRIGR|nr:hypothetical protein I79_013099 [Cricetulus griseus]